MTPEDIDELFAKFCGAYPAHGAGMFAMMLPEQFRAAASAIEAATIERCSIRAMTWCMENGMNANVATELDIAIRALAKEKS